MPDEYFFRGSVSQYWNIVYAEYQRLRKSLGRNPFQITAPNPASQDLAKYTPDNGETIMLAFWNTEHTYEISVDAEFSPDREMVQVMVFYQGPFTKEGESALAMWRKLKRELEKDCWLIDMAKSVVKPEKPPKPKSGSDLTDWFDWYHAMLDSGFKVTYQKIADETGYALGTVKQKHSLYIIKNAK